jgi:tetratricopeptide (TPR) repeat protein
LVERIAVENGEDEILAAVGQIGNCAVELEMGKLFQEAGDLYERALSLFPVHAGVNMQYADYLLDRREFSKAREHLARARREVPEDGRLIRLELKLAILEDNLPQEVMDRVSTNFTEHKGDRRSLLAYLDYLEYIDAPVEEYDQACREWADASSEPDAPVQGLRILADRYAKLDHFERAKMLYEQLLPKLSAGDRHDVFHNIATVCANLGLVAEAMRYLDRGI